MTVSDMVERFAKLTSLTRAGVIVGVSVIFGAVFYSVFYSDLAEQSRQLRAQLVERQAEKATYEDRKQRYRAFRAEVNRLLEEQKELLKVLPDDANISTFLQSIHAQAELAGVSIVTYDQQAEVPHGFYAQIPVQMEITGNYHQISKFFYYLERDVKRIIRIQHLALGAPQGTAQGTVLKAQFVTSTYRFIGERPG